MTSPCLRPVAGTPREVLALLHQWLSTAGPIGPAVVRTSGSSGRPKDVVLSREALVASADATHNRLGGPGQWLLDLPAHYVAGLQVLVRSVLAGTDPVIAGDHPTLLDAIGAMTTPRRYVSLVPTQLHRIARAGALGILADLDAVLIGGASLAPDLADSARAAGVPVVRTYGMSETAGGCVYDGLPLDGVQVRIDDAGIVHLAGPMLFDGYRNDAAATARVLRDGWFTTDDLGELTGGGRLRILGRGDDVVISGGVNVSLPAVTDALASLPGVREAMAVGVGDPEWGTRVVACIVPGGGPAPLLDLLRDGVEEAGLPRTWAPRSVLHVDAFPLLENGKVDRQALRALAASPPPAR